MFLHINVHTPVGQWSGCFNQITKDRTSVLQDQDLLKKEIEDGKLVCLTLYTKQPDLEINIPGQVLANSVLLFSIVDRLY